MDEQNRNLLLAMVLSTAVLFVWFILFPPPETQAVDDTAATTADGSVALPGEVPSVDDVAAKWGEITDLSAAQRATFSLG